jgi:outer membrane lipoprotein carrier protein
VRRRLKPVATAAVGAIVEDMPVVYRAAATLALAVALIPVPSVNGRAADLSANDLAAALQKKYDAVKDFSADFTHVYRGGVLRKQLTERGRVLVKKPGKMRWEYTAPEEKLFVSDGVKIYSYLPQDKQVIVSSVPPDDQASTPTLFLAGKGNLTRDFSASLDTVPDGMPSGTRALKLVPRNAQRDYESLVLVVDPVSYQIRGLITIDAQGGKSTFSFTNLKENVGLPDTTFAFKIPRGVDVVSTGSRP